MHLSLCEKIGLHLATVVASVTSAVCAVMLAPLFPIAHTTVVLTNWTHPRDETNVHCLQVWKMLKLFKNL